MESPVELSQLPTEIQQKILSYLPTRDLVAVECVSRGFQQHVNDLLGKVRVLQVKAGYGRAYDRHSGVHLCDHLQEAYHHRTIIIDEVSSKQPQESTSNGDPLVELVEITEEDYNRLVNERRLRNILTQATVDKIVSLAKRCPDIECLDLFSVFVAYVDVLLQLVEAFPKLNCLCINRTELVPEDWNQLRQAFGNRLVHLRIDDRFNGPISRLITGPLISGTLQSLFYSRGTLDNETAETLNQLDPRVEINLNFDSLEVTSAISQCINRSVKLKTLFNVVQRLVKSGHSTVTGVKNLSLLDLFETGFSGQNTPPSISFPNATVVKVHCQYIKKVTEFKLNSIRRLEVDAKKCAANHIMTVAGGGLAESRLVLVESRHTGMRDVIGIRDTGSNPSRRLWKPSSTGKQVT